MTVLSRRQMLVRSLGAACCAAASPLVTPIVLAAAPGENRLVVIVLRGAMDGLAAFPPLGDRTLAAMRPRLRADGVLELDDRFGMHPELAPLLPLWQAGELAVAQAVATPYRGKRSHFDGQDLLEAGGSNPGEMHDGWLNRALSMIPDARPETALSVGRESMLLMRGEAPTRAWAPGDRLQLRNDERGLLTRLYEGDPLFLKAMQAAEGLAGLQGPEAPAAKGDDPIARFAGERLAAEARIAAFSIGGWDTHVGQGNAIVAPLGRLAQAVVTLRDACGPAWDKTLVVAMTEFGRTARENGSGGTDHGTGGAALLAGGAVRGGRVYGDWPGLGEGALYQDRDLMPTLDVRAFPALALSALFGLDPARIERDIFPGLEMTGTPSFLA